MPATANVPESRPGAPRHLARAEAAARRRDRRRSHRRGRRRAPLLPDPSALGVIISDTGLIVCLVAPTAVLLLVCLIPRARAWALQAAVASALASVALVVFVFGGIALITAMLSDPA